GENNRYQLTFVCDWRTAASLDLCHLFAQSRDRGIDYGITKTASLRFQARNCRRQLFNLCLKVSHNVGGPQWGDPVRYHFYRISPANRVVFWGTLRNPQI